MRFAMKKATSSGRLTPPDVCLGHEDRDAGLELGRLDGHRQPPAEARLETLLEPLDFLRVAVAGEDHLVLALEQLVEGVEELFLRALLAGEELDVVDQQCIERAVRGLELVHRVVLQRPHHVADEALRVHVGDARLGIALLHQVRDGVHEMGLAQPDAAVQEQRVVGAAGIFRDLERGRLGELVALALDEGGEAEVGIEPRADHQPLGAAHVHGQGGRADALRRDARADLDRDDGRIAGAFVAQQLADAGQQVGVDPVDCEAVRRQKLQRAVTFHGLQRADPRIELLLGELCLQRADAACPKRCFHRALPPRRCCRTLRKRLRSLYRSRTALKIFVLTPWRSTA